MALGAARALGGAVLFSLPLLMTREMWRFGSSLSPWRLATVVVAGLGVVVVLVRYLGFRDTAGLRLADHVADAFVAFGVGALASAGFLLLFGIIDIHQSLREVVGLVAIQSVPASFGAAIARSQLVAEAGRGRREVAGYPYEILLMAVGAGLVAFNVAPTDEVVVIAARVGDWQGAAVAGTSIVALHAIVYLLGFRGQHRSEAPTWSVLFGYTLVGYAVTLAVCAALLWAFSRTAAPVGVVAVRTVVLAVPGVLGAGAARLIL